MKLTYDPRYNIAYLRLAGKTAEVETIQVREELKVDMAPDGKVYGIEFLSANEQLHLARCHLSLENRATGTAVEVALP